MSNGDRQSLEFGETEGFEAEQFEWQGENEWGGETEVFGEAEVMELAGQAAADARAGLLEGRPDTCTPMGCAFPALCRCATA